MPAPTCPRDRGRAPTGGNTIQARTIRSAPAAHVEDLAYQTAHLKADPKATAIVSDVEAESATLQTQIQDWDSKRHAVQETQTGLGNLTATLRNAVRHAHNEILDDLDHDRRAPKFLTYFPRGLVAFTKASYLDLVTDVRSLIQRCAQDTSPRIQEQATALQAAVDQEEIGRVRGGVNRAETKRRGPSTRHRQGQPSVELAPPETFPSSGCRPSQDPLRPRSALPRAQPIAADDVNLGAGVKTYSGNCAVCHGAADGEGSNVAQGLYQHAPQLAKHPVDDDEEGETYWKIYHGIRLTGMPSYHSTLTKTQMWQVTLFLKHMSDLPPAAKEAWLAVSSQAAKPDHGAP